MFFLQLHNRSVVGGGGVLTVMFLQKAHVVLGDYRPHVFHTGVAQFYTVSID